METLSSNIKDYEINIDPGDLEAHIRIRTLGLIWPSLLCN